MRFVKADGDLVDDAVLPRFTDARLDELGISAVDVVLGEDATDALDALDNGRFARGRAVLSEQELEHVGGHDRVALDLPDQVLADDEAVVCARGDFLVLRELSSLAAPDQGRGRGILAL